MQDFRRLRVWQAARELTAFVYRATQQFPVIERYALVAQMRSAALSIAANVAEGAARGSDRDSKRFLQMAFGSSRELSSHFAIAADLGYVSQELLTEANRRTDTVSRMLGGLMAKLK